MIKYFTSCKKKLYYTQENLLFILKTENLKCHVRVGTCRVEVQYRPSEKFATALKNLKNSCTLAPYDKSHTKL